MALTAEQQRFAYYVVATVETNCDYGGVNMVDAITLGVVQWYGQHAFRLMDKLRTDAADAYALLSDRLRNLCEGGAQSWGYWTDVYLNQTDAASWKTSAKLKSNQDVQDALFMADAFGEETNITGEQPYYKWLLSKGVEADAKKVIFWMTIFHQSPQSCSRGLASIGGGASIESIRDWALSDKVLHNYANRENTVYRLLNEWDGTSNPPKFGDVSTTVPGDPGGAIEGSTLQSQVSYIQAVGDSLIIHGKVTQSEQLLCYNTGRGIWVPNAGTVTSNPGAGTPSGGDVPGAGSVPADFPAMKQLWLDNANRWGYRQAGGRLNPDVSGYSDCSACIYWAANKATNNKYANMGTWTQAMLENNHVILETTDGTLDLSKMRTGDLILMDYNGGNTDHVDWYWGNGVVWGAGSAPLPHHVTDDAANYLKTHSPAVRKAWVVRFLD